MYINFIHNHINYRKYKKNKFDPYKYVIKFIKNKLCIKPNKIKYTIESPKLVDFYDDFYQENRKYKEQGIITFYTSNKRYIQIIKKYEDIFGVNGYDIEIK